MLMWFCFVLNSRSISQLHMLLLLPSVGGTNVCALSDRMCDVLLSRHSAGLLNIPSTVTGAKTFRSRMILQLLRNFALFRSSALAESFSPFLSKSFVSYRNPLESCIVRFGQNVQSKMCGSLSACRIA